MAKREKIALRVIQAKDLHPQARVLYPADRYNAGIMRERDYNTGDILYADLKKLRSRGLNAFLHQVAKLCAENLPEFEGMSAHSALKRLQLESGTACDEIQVDARRYFGEVANSLTALPDARQLAAAFQVIGAMIPDGLACMAKTPRSLSFSTMDEAEFLEVGRAICAHIAKVYWPGKSAEDVEAMALVLELQK